MALLSASRRDNIYDLKKILASGVIEDMEPALYYTIENKNLDILILLLEAGGSSNSKYNDLFLLQHAVLHEYSSITKELLQHHANPDHQDLEGNTPLHIAVSKNNIKLVRILLTYGANINIVNNKGWVPLCIAVRDEREQIIRLLLDFGAQYDLNIIKFLLNRNERMDLLILFKSQTLTKSARRLCL